MSDDGWVSDADSVEQDTFNKSNFNTVRARSVNERKDVVKGTEKPGFIQTVLPPRPVTTTSKKSADELEKKESLEVKELEQAREIKKASLPAAPKPAPAVIASPPSRNESFNVDRKPSVNVVRKLSFNAARKPSFNGSRKGSINAAVAPPPRERFGSTTKFDGRYDQEVIDFFSKMNEKSITQQAIEYLNAYWDEVGDQAEFIFSVAHRIFREADMHRQGITLYYKYEEGSDVDYPTYLYFYEKLCKFVAQNPEWREGKYEKSAVYDVKTAIHHKKELQEKVDVNFDGRISFLEFLLYQYNVFSNPAQFMERSRMAGEEHPAVIAARLALEKVNEQIKAYEMERARLEEGAQQPGVKGLTFKHQLIMLDVSPIAEELNKALITAEAAVRMAVRKFQGSTVFNSAGGAMAQPRGALWWMQRDLEDKKAQRKRLART